MAVHRVTAVYVVRSLSSSGSDVYLERNIQPFRHLYVNVILYQNFQDGAGHYNPWEAKVVAGLCNYLLVQGTPAKEITVLAAYRKQIAYIVKEVSIFISPHVPKSGLMMS